MSARMTVSVSASLYWLEVQTGGGRDGAGAGGASGGTLGLLPQRKRVHAHAHAGGGNSRGRRAQV
eukprot:scaffold40455_cov49-Phaeocystis_antarctica.AAC.2